MDKILSLFKEYSVEYSSLGNLLGENFSNSFIDSILNAFSSLDLLKLGQNTFGDLASSFSMRGFSIPQVRSPLAFAGGGDVNIHNEYVINNNSDWDVPASVNTIEQSLKSELRSAGIIR